MIHILKQEKYQIVKVGPQIKVGPILFHELLILVLSDKFSCLMYAYLYIFFLLIIPDMCYLPTSQIPQQSLTLFRPKHRLVPLSFPWFNGRLRT